jgi:hypothetical protein
VPGGATTGPVVVRVGGVSSNGQTFTVSSAMPTPTITSIAPSSGPVGTTVTISGANFGASRGASTVTFNGIAATPASWSATSINVPVPGGATTGPVVVTVGGVASNGVGFTVSASQPTTPTLVQHVSKDAGNTTSSTLAFAAGNTAGNWIAVVIRAAGSGQVFTVTDTRGNTYRKAVQFNETVDGTTLGLFYAENIAAGPNTVTVADTINGRPLRFAILEYAGIATANSLDVTATAQGTSSAPGTPSATTTANGDLVIGILSTANSATITAGSGYTIQERVPASPNTKLAVEDRIQATAGPVSANGTLGSPDVWAAAMAAFRAAGGGSPPPPAPTITSVAPSSGPAGTMVTISGTNFGASQGTSTVTFNGTTAAPTSWSATSISVPVPGGATTGPVIVRVGGVSSNGQTFTVSSTTPAPTITGLSPSSGPVGTTVTISGTNFGSTQGTSTVRFNGTTAAPTSWSATSISVPVPASATSGPVVVTVGGVASNGVGFTVSTSQSATPTLAQHVSSSANPVGIGISGNNFKIPLPNAVGAGNCLILGISYPAGRTVTVTDNNGNTWPTTAAVAANTSGTYVAAIYVLPNARPGATTLTVGFNASVMPFQYTLSEFYNVATVTPVNGTSQTARQPGASLSTGSFTPGNNNGNGGNLIWSYFAIAAGAQANPSSFVAGPNFSLLDADIAWNTRQGFPHASQYSVQPTSTAVNPAMTATNDSTNVYNGVSVALKAAAAGTPPPAGIRIVRVLHMTSNIPPTTTWPLQVPSMGNLIVLVTNESNVINLSSVTDSNGNTYTKKQPDASEPQIWFAGDARAGSNLQVALHIANTPATATVVAYDIVGAASSPFDVVAGKPATSTGGGTSITNAPTITPTTANGLVIASMVLGQGPGLAVTSPAGATWDLVTYSGEVDTDLMENADAKAHVYNATTATQNWNWTITSVGNNSYAAVAAAFKGAGGGTQAPAATPTIATVSPTSGPVGTVVTISGTNFGASQGTSTVTFNGTAASPTSWSSTSIAVPVPAGATTGNVVVTVGGVTSNGQAFTVSTPPPPTGSAVPGLVQQLLVQSNQNFESGNGFINSLPNPVLSGNCVLLAVTYARKTGRTVAITDNIGTNNWTLVAGPFNDSSGNFTSAIYASFNTKPGTQRITVTFDAKLFDFQAVITEWYNVATANALDGSAAASVNAPTIAAGTITTTQGGDLVYQYGIDTGWGVAMEGNSFTGYTAGTGFTLLSADRRIAVVNQYTVQAASGSINPTFHTTGGAGDSFATVAVALRSAQAGTPPDPRAMRIVTEYHTRVNAGSPKLNFPTVGNLFVITTAYHEGQETLQGVSDTNGNAWSVITGTQDPQMAYGRNATPGSNLVLTLNVAERGSGNMQLLIYDVVNADPNPYVKTAYAGGTAAGNSVVRNAPSLTPQYSNGLVFTSLNLYTGPPSSMTGPAGVVFDSIYYTGATDLTPQDSGDGYGHYYPTSTSQVSFDWQLSNGGTSTGWSAAAWEFKSAAAAANQTMTLAAASSAAGEAAVAPTETMSTSAPGRLPLSVSVTPQRSAITSGQTQQFAAAVANDPGNSGVSWLVDGIPSGTPEAGTITAWGLFTPGTTPGVHAITATSLADPSLTATVSVAVTDLAGVLTYRNDAARSGQNLKEYALSPDTVSAGAFGPLFSCAVDDVVRAQPLYVANVDVGGSLRNVLVAVTESDSVYAFDADDPTCVEIWTASLPRTMQRQAGVASTPVIDPATNTIYLVRGNRLHALDLLTGLEKLGGPKLIGAPGLDGLRHTQQSALLLDRGSVYVTLELRAGATARQEWVLGYDAATLAPTYASRTTDVSAAADASIGAQTVGATAVSASGTRDVIVWLVDRSRSVAVSDRGLPAPSFPATLRAYDANNPARLLFSSVVPGPDGVPLSAETAMPTIANGKVYIGGRSAVTVFGLRPN